MSRPEAALMKSTSATHNNKTHFTRNASSLYGAFFISKEVINTMKKNLFKRGMAGLLSLVMCLTALVGIGTTTAYAAGERAEVYLVSFPRSGDANIDYSGTWGHPNLRYMNGWHSGESKYTTIRAMHSYDGTLKETGTEMMPFNNIFNEWYAAQTSKKIRAVWKNKAANGKRVSSSVPFGYVRNPQDKEEWLVDGAAAEVVRKIYALCLDGRGPSQIARQLEQEKVLIPTAYYASLGRKTRKQYTDPYAWDQKTVAGILVNQQYTGCTVNFMTTTVSYKVHKTVYKPKDEWQIIPNTQPAIIDEDTWKRVQELREHRIRPTATGRTSLFSGKVFCADCGSKLHFCAAKSLNTNQEHYRCANYKSGRGSCQIHFIRNVVLEKIVLEAINSLADFVRCYEPVFLYLMAQKDIVSKRTETSKLRTAIESGKRRIQDLDKLIERIYEDQVLGNISAERYARMSVNYENEQRTLINKVAEGEKKLACIEQTSLDLKTLLKVLRSSTSFEELTPTLVNSLIRRIEVHNNDKSSGHCYVKVDIYFTAIGLIDIPTEDEIKSLMAKIKANPQEYRLTA